MKVTDEKSPLLSSGACTAIGEIGRNGALPLPEGEGDAGDGEITKLSVVNNLLAIVRSGKENAKVYELLLYSRLSISQSRSSFQTTDISKINFLGVNFLVPENLLPGNLLWEMSVV